MTRKKYEELELDDGTIIRYRRHENGGGMVALRAAVDPSARIEENAWVDQDAAVGPEARLCGGCWLEPGARVAAGAHVGTAARVGPGAVVDERARIGSRAHIGAGAKVRCGGFVSPDTDIPAAGQYTRAA